jgi:hypothetical protein
MTKTEQNLAEAEAALAKVLKPRQFCEEKADATDQQEDWTARELALLYNYTKDDSRQFTRWNMMTAISHGHRLGLETCERYRAPEHDLIPVSEVTPLVEALDETVSFLEWEHDKDDEKSYSKRLGRLIGNVLADFQKKRGA